MSSSMHFSSSRALSKQKLKILSPPKIELSLDNKIFRYVKNIHFPRALRHSVGDFPISSIFPTVHIHRHVHISATHSPNCTTFSFSFSFDSFFLAFCTSWHLTSADLLHFNYTHMVARGHRFRSAALFIHRTTSLQKNIIRVCPVSL